MLMSYLISLSLSLWCTGAPRGYFNEGINIRQFIEWCEDKLNIREKKDWATISTADVGTFVTVY